MMKKGIDFLPKNCSLNTLVISGMEELSTNNNSLAHSFANPVLTIYSPTPLVVMQTFSCAQQPAPMIEAYNIKNIKPKQMNI